MQEARNLALKAELLLTERPRNENYRRYSRVDNQPTTDKGKSMASSSNIVDVGGKGAASGGNMSKGNTTNQTKPNNPYAKPTLGKCFRCNEPGHKSNKCPKRRG